MGGVLADPPKLVLYLVSLRALLCRSVIHRLIAWPYAQEGADEIICGQCNS